MFSQTCFPLIDSGYVNKHRHSVCVADKWWRCKKGLPRGKRKKNQISRNCHCSLLIPQLNAWSDAYTTLWINQATFPCYCVFLFNPKCCSISLCCWQHIFEIVNCTKIKKKERKKDIYTTQSFYWFYRLPSNCGLAGILGYPSKDIKYLFVNHIHLKGKYREDIREVLNLTGPWRQKDSWYIAEQ